MTMPNFFIIGAQKAGTTSLYHYLAQHPQVYMSPVKEPYFFDHEIDSAGKVVRREVNGPGARKSPRYADLEEYRALFAAATDGMVVGEASTPYMYAPGTAERIRRYVPQAKIIAVLRDPADRAYSAFLHAVRIGREPLTDFAQALQEEEGRVRGNWDHTFHYRSRGFYSAQLERYYGVFEQDRIGVWLYEDLRDDPTGVAQSIFRFLGVDGAFVPNTSLKHNPAGVPRNGAARAILKAMDTTASAFLRTFTSKSRVYPLLSKTRKRIQGQIVAKPEPIDPVTRGKLIEGYRKDILRLQDLVGRDLSMWLEGKDSDPSQTARTADVLG